MADEARQEERRSLLARFDRLARAALRRARTAARLPLVLAVNAGGRQRCPICNRRVRRFLPHGDPPRQNARCPVCGSLERHRLDWLFLKQRTGLFDGAARTMLHVAPEKFLGARFRRIPNLRYLSADLNNPRAMVRMDITAIDYPAGSFSVIYCSHVLEHVPDDRRALAELYRVLAPGGFALLQVPISAAETLEDPTATTPDERLRRFGKDDHVRRCGPDYADRIRAAGFQVEVVRASDLLSPADRARFGIHKNRLIFSCRKPLPD